ncbi:MAG: hydrogenase maturation protease [Gammaproteobacteria bacterium]
MPRLTVIGIGSPYADDRAGWYVVERLDASGCVTAYGGQVVATACRSPASELMNLFVSADVAVVVDAVRFCGAAGTIYRLADAHSRLLEARFLSSHGVDFPAMLALADTRGHRPREVIIYGIEAGPAVAIAEAMCDEVSRAAARVADDIKQDIVNHVG